MRSIVILAFSSSAYSVCVKGVAQKKFSINNDGTVTDVETKLMWKQCIEGMKPDGANGCAGVSNSTYTWQNALIRASNANAAASLGYKDWRLPNVKELQSIAELKCFSPAINLSVFPLTPPFSFWSSTPYNVPAAGIYYVYFGNGSVSTTAAKTASYVRLVRN